MKHLTYADRSLLIGDEAADTLLRFAAELSDSDRADTVKMNAIDDVGNVVVASFVLGAGVNLMAKSMSSTYDEPDNTEALEYMRAKMDELASPNKAAPFDEPLPSHPEM
jgi:hypothetical protein